MGPERTLGMRVCRRPRDETWGPIYEITLRIHCKPLFLLLIYLSCNVGAKSLFGKRNYVDPPNPLAYSGVEWEKVGQSGRLPLGAALGRKGSVSGRHPSRAGQQGSVGDTGTAPRSTRLPSRRAPGAYRRSQPLPAALSAACLGADPAAADGAV